MEPTAKTGAPPWSAITPTGGQALLLVVLSASLLMILWVPRRVAPTETPGLRLDRSAVEGQLALDAGNAKKAPTSPVAKTLERLYRDYGTRSASGYQAADVAARMREQRIITLRKLRDQEGDGVMVALRAQAAEVAIPAITGKLPKDELHASVGRLIDQLFHYGMAEGAHVVAPGFVVRTAAKLRWNLVFDRKPTEGFTPIEQQAYFGWIALQAAQLSPGERLIALQRYEEAGGPRIDEARATLLSLVGDWGRAQREWNGLFDRTKSLRHRNHALFALDQATAAK